MNSISMISAIKLGGVGSIIGTAMLVSIPYNDSTIRGTMKYLVPGFGILGLSFCLMFLAPAWFSVNDALWAGNASICFVTTLWVFGLRNLQSRIVHFRLAFTLAFLLSAAVILTRCLTSRFAYYETPALFAFLGIFALLDHWRQIQSMQRPLALFSIGVYTTYILLWITQLFGLLEEPNIPALYNDPPTLHLQDPFSSIVAICYTLLPISVTTYLTLLINNSLVNRLRHQAFTDVLTGVKSRLALDQISGAFIASSKRLSLLVAVIILDIDHFKTVNDQFGHLAGDHVLQEFAHIIANKMRADDILVRYGGEEFVILCRVKPHEYGHHLTERLSRAINNHVFTWKHNILSITMSGGMVLLQDSETLAEAIGRADNLLYEAKIAGRNRILVGYDTQSAHKYGPKMKV